MTPRTPTGLAIALLVHPLLALAQERPVKQAEPKWSFA